MKKFIAIIVLVVILTWTAAYAEPTMDELQEFIDNHCTCFEDTQDLTEDIAVQDIEIFDKDRNRLYHFVLVVEGSEAEGTWTAQLIATEKDRGWIGNWYEYSVDQFEEDWIKIVTEMYEGTL